MKKGIHPENYRPVVFKDMSNGDMFLSRSTCATKDTIEFEGETYPLVKLEISNTSVTTVLRNNTKQTSNKSGQSYIGLPAFVL